MSKRWFYKEELFFTTEETGLREENQDKIIELLGRNVAVGGVRGFYEGGFSGYFIFLLFTSPGPPDRQETRLPSSAWKKKMYISA